MAHHIDQIPGCSSRGRAGAAHRPEPARHVEPLSQPGTSKHLRVLREAGLVRARTEGRRRVYELRAGPLAELDAWLAPYRRMWEDSLDALEQRLNATEVE